MNKIITLLITLLLISGCSPKINEHFEQNRYVKNFNVHLVNDSLQLYFKSPSDITYTRERKSIKEGNSKCRF